MGLHYLLNFLQSVVGRTKLKIPLNFVIDGKPSAVQVTNRYAWCLGQSGGHSVDGNDMFLLDKDNSVPTSGDPKIIFAERLECIFKLLMALFLSRMLYLIKTHAHVIVSSKKFEGCRTIKEYTESLTKLPWDSESRRVLFKLQFCVVMRKHVIELEGVCMGLLDLEYVQWEISNREGTGAKQVQRQRTSGSVAKAMQRFKGTRFVSVIR
jgi:hypothetical protein